MKGIYKSSKCALQTHLKDKNEWSMYSCQNVGKEHKIKSKKAEEISNKDNHRH